MYESTRRSHCFLLLPCCSWCTSICCVLSIIQLRILIRNVIGLGFLSFSFLVLGFHSTTSRSCIHLRSSHLGTPRQSDQCAMRKRSKSSVDDLPLGVAFVVFIAILQNCGYLEISLQVNDRQS